MNRCIQKANINNILLIKIAAIGDLLMITPAVRVLKKNFPQAKITLLVGKWSRAIIEGNPYIDEIIEVPDTVFFKFRPAALLRLIFELRRRHFGLVMVWHRSLAFRVFAWLLGIKTRVGFARRNRHEFLTHFVDEDPQIHEIYEYQSTLRPLGIESAEIDMDLAVSDQDRAWAKDKMSNLGITANDLVIGIAPGGAKNPKECMPLRQWPKEYFSRLIDKLVRELKAKVILLGSRDDCFLGTEIIKNAKIIGASSSIAGDERAPVGAVHNLCGATTLKQLAAIIDNCNVFIGNDSAPMHIAAAVKTPVVSLFGPTDPKEKAPLNYKHIYLYAGLNCSPCYHDGKYPDCKTQECLRKILPEDVLDAIQKILGEGAVK